MQTTLFRGKNFIIKYEGSFKNGNTDCFVLEHIEHDRPEVVFSKYKCKFLQHSFSFI